MSQRGFSQLVVLAIVLLLLVVGGVWWYVQHSAGQSASAPKNQTVSEPVPASAVSASASASSESSNVASASSKTNAGASTGTAQTSSPPAPSVSCSSQYTDTAYMDIFDAHTHLISDVSAADIISEMNAAGVSMANLYPIDGDDDSSSLAAVAQYPARFITFVDTPDSPQPSAWHAEGQAFVTHATVQLDTGKFHGIGETNLRYYDSSGYTPPPAIYIPPDDPLWLQLINLSATYRVPISFHFVPDDATANAALAKMLGSNAQATFIWAHLGFNNMPLDSAALNEYLLQYPNLYFDTAGIQNMQNPLPQLNSNWARLTSDADNGRLNAEWQKFFETWNSRILFGSDAGGGSNGKQRWQNYAGNVVSGATPNAIGHWRQLFTNLDENAARNILSANAKALFLKTQKPPYQYSVSSGGSCDTISISSDSSISALAFDPSTRAITFTAALSSGTVGTAEITIPIALAGKNFTASVDGNSIPSQSSVSSADVVVRVTYEGGIRTVTLTAQSGPQ